MAFPRTIIPREVTPFRVPTGLASTGHTGKAQLRATGAMGREWDEIYPAMKVGTPEVDALLAYIEWAWGQKKIFAIKHLPSPGSGRVPHGFDGLGFPISVLGAGQTGDTLNVDGTPNWVSGQIGVMRAGDVFRIADVSPLFRVVEDVTADGSGHGAVKIDPPILIGMSPADDAVITTANNTLNAYIAAPPVLPPVPPGHYLAGLSLTFREAL